MAAEKESRVSSILSSESIRVIAESVGVSGIADEAASFLAEDISYRLKVIVQEAEKLRQHGKRGKLTCADFDSALQMKNIEPLYGFSSKDGNTPFRHASGGGREIFFTDEKEVDLQSTLAEQASKVPPEIALKAHWLCIDGVQPSLPENPPPASKDLQKKEILDPSLNATSSRPAKRPHPDINKHKHHHHHHKHKDAVKLKNLTTHELSVEQQYYYKEITESCVGPDEMKRSEALQSLQQDPGLHQMLPRFIAFAAEGVKINVVQNNLALLIYLMRMVKSLLDNQTIYLDKYLHDLLPAVMTCVVSRQLCLRPDMDNHWALRDFAARLVAQICRNYNNNTNNVQARVTKKFSKAIQSETAALATQYGAIAGLGELGTEVIKSCLLPYICMLGERIKAANEGSVIHGIDKVAAEHIKKQLVKYLPNVLKSFHNSSESVDEFNVAYGYLGHMMYSLFNQKEKSLTAGPPSALHTLNPPRTSLHLPQRPAQIVIQQPQSSVPPSSPFLTPTPSLSSLQSRPLPSTPTTPGGQKFVIVSQSRPSMSAPPPPSPSSAPAMMKLVTPQARPVMSSGLVKVVTPQPAPAVTPAESSAQPKFLLIQGGGSNSKVDDSNTSSSSGSQGSASSTAISGQETL